MKETPGSNRHDYVRSHYCPRLQTTTEHHDILDWASAEAQTARFRILAEVMRQRKLVGTGKIPRILDVGCGLTDLASYLEDTSIAVAYTGLELVPELAAAAKRKFPLRNVIIGDIAGHPPFARQSFECAFASGVFNLDTGDNNDYLPTALINLLDLVSDCVVVNFLHHRANKKYDHCHYYHPAMIMNMLEPYCRKIDIIDNYLENDFTLVAAPDSQNNRTR